MYRGDIEGLRAVAVIPVLLFHFGLTGFTGGYVGVDIFFVISGYLISTILLREIKNNQFSVFGFYDRRVRRIFPALVFVVGITTVFSYFFLLPREFQDYGQSLLATSLFSSNFLFWMEAGYFDAESHSKPLLHTWSLAVEEQYYLFYPLLLAFAYRLGRVTLVAILCLLASLSFMVSVWLSAADSSSAFYLLHSRLWELLIGSIIAIHGFKPLRSKLLNEILSIVALVAIAYPIIFF